ncbi:hypothetical protein CHISP_3082 [Chitinispirillum alkaliphilum]|nr:hypothetical protein CHISP_3082 [Chitinispirillum alkaliphilum]
MEAQFNFTVQGTMNNPRIRYARLLRDVPYDESYVGAFNVRPIPSGDIVELNIPPTPISIGSNNITFSGVSSIGEYAFVELVIEGEDESGRPVTSDVGFLPYRSLETELEVQVLDLQGNPIPGNRVRAGHHVMLRITPTRNGEPFIHDINHVRVSLGGNRTLFDASTDEALQIDQITHLLSSQETVYFTTIPPSGENEIVRVSAYWENPQNPNQSLPFLGASDPITILPGDPYRVEFDNPPSNRTGIAPPTLNFGDNFDVEISVRDEYGNRVDQSAGIIIESLQPEIGDIVGSGVGTSNEEGRVQFEATVTGGLRDDLFDLRAIIAGNPNSADTAAIRVGEARNRLAIFYENPLGTRTEEVRGRVGVRFPVVIEAHGGIGGTQLQTNVNSEISFTLTPSANLRVYQTQESAEPITQTRLTEGRAVVWITGVDLVTNGRIAVSPVDDITLLGTERAQIYFTPPPSGIEHGIVFANNGYGRLDSMAVFYTQPLSDKPDSIVLYWPREEPQYRRKAYGEQLEWDSANPTLVAVRFSEPFGEGYTSFQSTNRLGTHYYTSPGATNQIITRFDVIDSIGPLITSATLVERLTPGVDTIIASFSESINPESLRGETLLLRKAGFDYEIPLNVISAISEDGRVRFIIEDNGELSPAEHDLLRFNPGSGVRDARHGATVHPENRPVALNMRQVPPGIDSAFYYDTNADGIVDNVIIWLNKEENISNLTFTFSWTLGNTTGEISGEAHSYGDNSVIAVNVRDAFNNSVDNQTSGNMTVTINSTDYDRAVTGTVRDRAAPVITNAVYEFGEGENRIDTLTVVFSESVMENQLTATPFSFISPITGYQLELGYLGRGSGGSYRFSVNSTLESFVFPNNGDSIFINPNSGVRDGDENIQNNPANRRVPLEVRDPPINLRLIVGPSPVRVGADGVYLPSTGRSHEGLIIQIIGDNTQIFENINAKLDLAIYDKLGNIVYTAPPEAQERSNNGIVMTWDLRNRNGRFVSEGTYLLIANVTNLDAGRVILSERVKFAVVK